MSDQLVILLDLIVLRNNLNVELYKYRSICSLITRIPKIMPNYRIN